MSGSARLFSTCPALADGDAASFRQRAVEVARWSEAAGCEGILVYTDNRLPDPWLIAQVIVEATERLTPLVAVQPVYMHPYSVAKMVASLGALHGRRLALNMVAGGFKRDLESLGDTTPHDERYARLAEYAQVIQGLLAASSGPHAFSFRGRHYTIEGVRLMPALGSALQPDLFVSGSSEVGRRIAAGLGAVAIHYPDPAQALTMVGDPARRGVRIGIIARNSAEEAWRVAEERFPPDRKGEITHQLAMKASDSAWHHQLSARAEEEMQGLYWLRPFRTYKTFCPYLVGSVGEIAGEIGRYLGAGFDTFILDIPPDEAELAWVREVFNAAQARAAA